MAGQNSAPSRFAAMVLSDLGITKKSVVPTDVALLNAQQTAEGQWRARGAWNAAVNNNPFNIELSPSNAKSIGAPLPSGVHYSSPSNPISEFSTPSQGASATADFISAYDPNMASALAQGNTKAFLSPSGVGEWASKTDVASQQAYAQAVASDYGQTPKVSPSTSTNNNNNTSSTSSSSSAGGNLFTKIGYYGVGLGLLLVGLIVLFHGKSAPNVPSGEVEGAGTEGMAADVAVA